MKIEGKGIVIKIQKVQEKFALVSIFSGEHGMVRGLMKVSRAKTSYKVNCGDYIKFTKSTRLQSHLGLFRAELIKPYLAAISTSRYKIVIMDTVLRQLYLFFHEGMRSTDTYENTKFLFEIMRGDNKSDIITNFFKFQFFILAEMGYGLDLQRCAVTSSEDNLKYISPRTGRAVCESAGAPYKDKLFTIPEFLLSNVGLCSNEEIDNVTNIINHFFHKSDLYRNEKELIDAKIFYE